MLLLIMQRLIFVTSWTHDTDLLFIIMHDVSGTSE